ncbi:MAG: aspartate/glutamate racemase family protein [Bacteroidota bacterium]
MDYYRFINEGINKALGGLNFAECILYSLNFGDVQNKTWPGSYELLLSACVSLKKSGVDAIALCANTAHLFADELQKAVDLPFVHIGEETGKAVKNAGYRKAALLGTKVHNGDGFL